MIEYNIIGYRHFTLGGTGAICGTKLSDEMKGEIGNKIRYNPEAGLQEYWQYNNSLQAKSKWVNVNRGEYCRKCIKKISKSTKQL